MRRNDLRPKPMPGDHLHVSRGTHAHHAIYVGGGYVIHFTGAKKRIKEATIRFDTLETFAAGDAVEPIEYATALPPGEVIRRARARLGGSGYHLFTNNCEHFARWCKTGERMSAQVHGAAAQAAGVGAGASATVAALGVVSGAGVAAGVSGPGIMSGLSATGSLVGAGAAVGVPILAAGPATLTATAMHRVFRDDPHLTDHERAARRNARAGSTAGAAVGTLGTFGVLAAAGIPGLSAVGISSGLAAIGGVVGGGMLAGVVVTVAAPAVLTIALGHLVYRWSRSKR